MHTADLLTSTFSALRSPWGTCTSSATEVSLLVAHRLAGGAHQLAAAAPRSRRRLPATRHARRLRGPTDGGHLLEDPDDKLRTWAAQSVQRWHPAPDEPRGNTEVGELLERSQHLISDYVLRRRKWEAG